MTIKPMKIKVDDIGRRLDQVLSDRLENATFGVIQKLCRKGQIRLDGKRVKGSERVMMDQEIRIPPALVFGEPQREDGDTTRDKKGSYDLNSKELRDLENDIIFEDDSLVVVNKPYGLPVQAGSGHSKSLDRMMVSLFQKRGIEEMPRLVHRLDKTTTGAVVLAKTREVAARLSRMFQVHDMNKTYWAIVTGRLKETEGVIRTEIQKVGDKEGNDRMVTVGAGEVARGEHIGRGQKAVTEWKLIDSAGEYHWLEIKPKTGRTHQIRLHMASVGMPILGDMKYGGKRVSHSEEGIPNGRVFLHARVMEFKDEQMGQKSFVAKLPHHFKVMFELVDWKE
jgi:23S rRNA pseudouridine955/2504/2580 synthase